MSSPLLVQKVTDVERATRPLEECSPKDAIERLLKGQVECCSEYQGSIVPCQCHPFVTAVHVAFAGHRPLVLSPDMFWLLIAQGLGRHINNHSEDLRHRFVSHEGKETLVVRRDDFFKGSLENPWGDVLDEFSGQIKARIGEENHANIVVKFSSTGPIEKAANEVALMDALKSYFEYSCHTICGIPEVTLEGEKEDWEKLREKAAVIGGAYDLQWWTERLLPILDAIVNNAAGADDPTLWQNIYKIDSGSGGPYINGWIVDFFPYLMEEALVDAETNEIIPFDVMLSRRASANAAAPNGEVRTYGRGRIEKRNWTFSRAVNPRSIEEVPMRGISAEALPGSLSKVPFKRKYHDQEYDMEFIAGFTGFTQNAEALAVRPKIGWAVREVT